jgi:hypothetical protein
MWEKLTVLGFSLLVAVGSLALGAWLIATGQAVGVEALFLAFTCLIFAGVGALVIWLSIKRDGKSSAGA